MKIGLIALALGILVGSLAANAQTKPKDLPACAPLVKACDAAGFRIGGHKNNDDGVWVDCIGARAKNNPVKGISFSQGEAQACQTAAKADRATMKK